MRSRGWRAPGRCSRRGNLPRRAQALAPLAEARPTARVCLLMAEIEEAENGMTGLAREWLARAAHAPRDPAWVADGTSFPHWAPFAPESGRIGVFVWEHPPEWVETAFGARQGASAHRGAAAGFGTRAGRSRRPRPFRSSTTPAHGGSARRRRGARAGKPRG